MNNVELTRNHVKKLEAKIVELKAIVALMIPLHEASGCETLALRAREAIGAGEGYEELARIIAAAHKEV